MPWPVLMEVTSPMPRWFPLVCFPRPSSCLHQASQRCCPLGSSRACRLVLLCLQCSSLFQRLPVTFIVEYESGSASIGRGKRRNQAKKSSQATGEFSSHRMRASFHLPQHKPRMPRTRCSLIYKKSHCPVSAFLSGPATYAVPATATLTSII